jgi:hypothetical protein
MYMTERFGAWEVGNDERRGAVEFKLFFPDRAHDASRVNRYVSGWVNYFHVHNSTQVFTRLRFFLEQRMRKYLQKRRQLRGNGIRRWPAARLYKELGLCAIPIHARYRQTRPL